MTDNPYTANFFRTDLARSYASAQRIVPLVMEFLRVRSVLDVGCGTGDFLRAFGEAGVADMLGLDGDYVPREQLAIDAGLFRPTDLARPFDLGRGYDLVVSLEVAEHLPPSAAEGFVASLVRHGSLVLFSAAIPGQGGTGHRNEQWQIYWAEAFARHGYHAYDVVRPAIWNIQEIASCYRQNTLVFATETAAAQSPRLSAARSLPPTMVNLVHPLVFIEHAARWQAAVAQQTSLHGPLHNAGSFDVDHMPDGKIVIRPK